MPQSHAATSPWPANRPAPFQAATNVSWRTSSTMPGSAHLRASRRLRQGACRRYNRPRASEAPAATAASSSASVLLSSTTRPLSEVHRQASQPVACGPRVSRSGVGLLCMNDDRSGATVGTELPVDLGRAGAAAVLVGDEV